jgi:hypothetical protein
VTKYSTDYTRSVWHYYGGCMIDGNNGDDPHPRQSSTLDDMPTLICLSSVAEKEETNQIMISMYYI